jgi:uncharacterized protein
MAGAGPTRGAGRDKPHNVDFESATRVFLDQYRLDEDVFDAHGEIRFNIIGIVDDQMLVVTCTMRGEVCRIISARRAERYEKRRYHEV